MALKSLVFLSQECCAPNKQTHKEGNNKQFKQQFPALGQTFPNDTLF